GDAELPRSLTWLWRDYDAAKTDQQFIPDPAEKDKEYYRVRIANRDYFRTPDHPKSPAPDWSKVQFKPEDLQKGTAVFAEREHFMLGVESPSEPKLFIDEQPGPAMKRVDGTNTWTVTGTWQTGRTHNVHYLIDGKKFGGKQSIIAYGPDSYEQPGVPKGQSTPKLVHTSKMYPGMKSDYWVYTPAGYEASKPAALMVWHDGEYYYDRSMESRALNVIDNLTHRKLMPVAVHVFIAPGLVGETKMRSVLYDTVDDKYARFIRDELLPEVYAKYNVRRDAYSRALLGESSGGISSFNIAWEQPDQFARAVCRINSFTTIQWDPGKKESGSIYPFRVRKQPKRNIRIWMSDGAYDLENTHGSWPMQNIQMANSLKMRGYDFHFNWTNATHTRAQGHAELPESLIWIWRDYDPSKTDQQFTIDPAEEAKPLFRVALEPR
ncbi:MAG TPA: alpha/beta hydrolase-fold protein, partial [Bryobacteraceae bacterium]|nr:alpha/beta hydrolase-fold protein [Bryobacteraceae bacterium]